MVDFDYQHMEFKFEGEFLGFVNHEGKLKYLRLKVLSEEVQIKIPKAVRMAVGLSLQPGESIQITGIGKFDRHTRELKLKATQMALLTDCLAPIVPVTPSSLVSPALPEPGIEPTAKPKIKVLVCQKSGCLKKGGKGLCEDLKQILRDRNLEQYVTIEQTGCVKRCSAAPNLVIMPGNKHYTEVRPKTLPKVVDAIAQSLAKH
jgi:(2Fe-2S) ferredoxin